MKRIKNLFMKIKYFNDEIMLKDEKLTIINRNRLLIQNYDKILEIDDEFIRLLKLTIRGKNLKLKTLSKYYLEIIGVIDFVQFGDKNEK